ncbi:MULTISPECIES: AAA family ATPase [unclassified Spirosoma]|uniref:AAA family ATPase n=1 Tax=unclassified Spirosoma TaxID=2621999 RepID=UPI0009606CB5|nr:MULTISPECIES: AAA family ATPase [unclassified Spirosoma]MBN8822296.1 AAA family ATPase [Spirosoma sp.]OJW72399.1 MAG: poly(A) polymerase [Spirosoma sp. 48-14]
MIWQLTDRKSWPDLLRQFDFVRDMVGVPQDPVHHAEGDVAVHTRMVLEALESLPGYRALPADEQAILWAAALLHDVEKRSTTVQEDDGRITSKGHARKGERTARLLLYDAYPTPFVQREAVAKLVRYHGLPLWVFEKGSPRQALLQASLEVNTAWLALLARADVLGRVCADQDELLYRIDLFEEFCREQDCWGKPYPFASNLTRFHYFRRDDLAPDFPLYDDTKTTVVLLSGLPGVGKDHYLLSHYRDWPVVSLDAFRRQYGIDPLDRKGTGRVVQMAKEQARAYLRSQQPFVWNATNITRNLRSQLIDLFVTYGAWVKVIYLEVPNARRAEQNANRKHPVPEPAVSRMLEKLEIPAIWEAHEVLYEVG